MSTDLSSEYRLSEEQISSFRDKGHIHLQGVCLAEEVAYYREIITSTANRLFCESRPLEERDAYGKAFLQKLNLRQEHPEIYRYVTSPRFARIAAELMGVNAVRIYHDQALFKEPGGGGTPWHQDQYYWPLETNNTLGMWMPLVDVSLQMGPVHYATHSHRAGCIANLAISTDSENSFEKTIREKGYPIWKSEINAGDALFHTGWTVHGAGSNRSNQVREAMVVTFYEDGARVAEFTNEHRPLDARHFLDNRQPGELAAGKLNPLVYQRDS